MVRPLVIGVKRRVQLRIDPSLIDRFDSCTQAQRSKYMNWVLAFQAQEDEGKSMAYLRDCLGGSMGAEIEQRGTVPKVTPEQIMELARHNRLIHVALRQFMSGELTYEESLAVAIVALNAENNRLTQMNMDLLDRMPPPPISVI